MKVVIKDEDQFDLLRANIKKEVKKQGGTVEDFTMGELGIHPNSWGRKWNNRTIQLKDLLSIAEKLQKELSVQFVDPGSNANENEGVSTLFEQIDSLKRIIDIQEKYIKSLEKTQQ